MDHVRPVQQDSDDPYLFLDIFLSSKLWSHDSPPSGTTVWCLTCPCLTLTDPAIPLLQRRHFDLQTLQQQEEHRQEKANGVEMLREQGEFEWGSISLNA